VYYCKTKQETNGFLIEKSINMAKLLKFKEVRSDVDARMKEFEKLRIKLNVARAQKGEGNTVVVGAEKKETKGLLSSISSFFSDTPKPVKKDEKKEQKVS
jgi:hypothetical protein